MTEQKLKIRGWVKNVAIVFLSVILVLTFFSNTIMNRSLPEVSAQYVQSGSISTLIRGSGNLEAAESYDLMAEDVRKVQTVLVRVGQEVTAGEVVMILAEGDSAELEAAELELENLYYSYQKSLISAGIDGGGESTAVTNAREDLEEAIADVERLAYATDLAVDQAKQMLDLATAEHADAVEELEDAGGVGSGTGGDYSAVTSAYDKLNAARTALDAVMIQYGEEYYLLSKIASHYYTTEASYSHAAYMQSLASQYSQDGALAVGDPTPTHADLIPDNINTNNISVTNVTNNAADPEFIDVEFSDPTKNGTFSKYLIAEAFDEVDTAEAAIDTAEAAVQSAEDAYDASYSPSNASLKRAVDEAKEIMDEMQAAYDKVVADNTALELAETSVDTYTETLESALNSDQLQGIDLQQQLSAIGRAQEAVNELRGGAEGGGEVISPVNGIVTAVNASAGRETSTDTPLAVIEVPDMGYTVSVRVTLEQSRNVTVGDEVQVSSGYWGSELYGTLTAIRPDTSEGSSGVNQNRLLVVAVEGDVEAGMNVDVAIGERSQNYDTIVPNSALREDSNGSYVLTVVAKSSPLGNRYIATRVDVEELAKDDNFTAVKGGLVGYDYVITNSTAPIEPGTQVRMADNT